MKIRFVKEYTDVPFWIDRKALNQLGMMGAVIEYYNVPVEPAEQPVKISDLMETSQRAVARDVERYAAYKCSTTDKEAAAKCGISNSRFAQWRETNKLPICREQK